MFLGLLVSRSDFWVCVCGGGEVGESSGLFIDCRSITRMILYSKESFLL